MPDQLERYKSLQATRKRRSRSISYNQEFVPEGQPYERYRWVENITSGLRFRGKVHEIKVDGYSRPIINHRGWYLDEFQDETCWGIVVQLPAGRDHKPRFVPGYQLSYDEEDSATLDFHSMTEDLTQAIRNADSMARIMSEEEREYQRKERIKTEIVELQESRIQARKEISIRIKEWKTFRKDVSGAAYDTLFGSRPLHIPPTVTLAIERGIRRRRAQMHMDWKRMKELEGEL